jgi:2-keto-3-deoxy-L-rhamnonate aldolase RhmA
VGPSDLALDVGRRGAELDEDLRRIARACREHGRLAGAFALGAEHVGRYVELGFEFLAIDSDASFLLAAARGAVSAARLALPPDARR